jgi:NitT/TauT family transport system substrate-binding protein
MKHRSRKDVKLALAIIMGTLIVLCGLRVAHDKREPNIIKISKSTWAAWDLYELGVNKYPPKGALPQIELLNHPTYSAAYESFVSGESDGITTTIYESLLAAHHGVPLKIVMLLDYTVGSDAVLASEELTSLIQLKGKTIGVERGSVSHYTLLKALYMGGLEKEDVTLVFGSTNEMVDRYVKNELDAISLYEPYLGKVKTLKESNVLFSSEQIPGQICDVLCFRSSVLSEFPQVVSYSKKSWIRILSDLKKYPEEILRNIALKNKINVEALNTYFEGIFLTDLFENEVAFGFPEKEGYLYRELNNMQDFMIKEGLLSRKLDIGDLIYVADRESFYDIL